MGKGEDKRGRMFNKFSRQLHLLVDNGLLNVKLKYAKTYICPICVEQFQEKDIITSDISNHLTEEDAPPAKLKGKRVALTCKKCNSTAGANIDLHLINRIMLIDISKHFPDSSYEGHINFEEKRINATISRHAEDLLEVNYIKTKNNPKLLDRYIKLVKKNDHLTVKPAPLKDETDRVNHAILKSSYILAFSKFGYIFLLDPFYDNLRDQIRLLKEGFEFHHFLNIPNTKNREGTYYILNPEHKGIMNIINFESKFSITTITSLLPFPDLNSTDFHANMTNRGNNTADGKIKTEIRTSKVEMEKDLFRNLKHIVELKNWIKTH